MLATSGEWVNVPDYMTYFRRVLPLGMIAIAAAGVALGVAERFPNVAAAQAPTLPPTWTPTFTPTQTDTPTVTPTQTATPTIDPAAFCDEGFFVRAPEPGASLPYDQTVSILAGSDAPGTVLFINYTHRLSGESQQIDIPQPGYVGYETPVRLLPRPGLYDWVVLLLDENDTVICEAQGYFFAGRQEWLEPSATPAPVTIVTATPDANVPTQTPMVIIVTATPDGTPPAPTQPSIRERGQTDVPATAITPEGS